MDLLLAIASLLAYFASGVGLARWRRERIWEKARAAWHFEDSQRSSVRASLLCWVALWPVVGAGLAAFSLLDGFADRGDPRHREQELRERERRLAERERRIAQLEREAGLPPLG